MIAIFTRAKNFRHKRTRNFKPLLISAAIALSFPTLAQAKTFDLQTAGIEDIQAAVDAGALSYEKLVTLYLARIAAYDKKGPALNTVITLNKNAIATARARPGA